MIELGLKASLEAYSRADTLQWASRVRSLSGEIGQWAAEKLESTLATDVRTNEEVDATHISDILLNLLLAPEFVSGLLAPDIRVDRMERFRPKTEARIAVDLTEHILTQLTRSFLSKEDFGAAVDQKGRYTSFKLFSLASNVPWLSEAVFGQAELHERISRTLSEDARQNSEGTSRHEPRIIRLDLIDAALYRALQGHPELLKTLDWRVFEKLLADMLTKLGYCIELQRGTKDGGVDLFAVKHDHFGPQRYLLQAKRWNHNVGIEPVRQLAFLHAYHRMTKSCLATTATFTKEAWNLGTQYQWQLELRDFEGLKSWLSQIPIHYMI